jgi:outer membrane protein TolC
MLLIGIVLLFHFNAVYKIPTDLYAYFVLMNHHSVHSKVLLTLKLAVVATLLLFNGHSVAQTRSLDYYISRALANNPLLKDYKNLVLSNGIDSLRLRAAYHPQVYATSNNMIAPVINGYGYDQILTNLGSYTTVVNVNQTFVGRENLKVQNNIFHLLTDSIVNAQKMSEQDLKRTVTAQYITAYGDMEQLNFNLVVHNMLIAQDTILKKLTQSNIYRQTDYLTFLVTLKQQELQLKQIRIQFQTDYSMLYYLCGIFDTSAAQLEAPAISLQHLPDESASVFFLHYKRDSLALQNNISILNYSYRPKLSAFANAGYSSSFLYQAEKNFGFSAGLNLSIPINDGHLKKLQTEKINLLENSRSNYQDFFKNQYSQQINMLEKQLTSTESLIIDINEQINYAQGLIDVNGKLLRTGDAKISDLIIALNNYLAAKNLLAQNNISRMQIINQLNYWNR